MNIYEIPSTAHIQKKKKGKKNKYQNGNSEIFREFPYQKKLNFKKSCLVFHTICRSTEIKDERRNEYNFV